MADDKVSTVAEPLTKDDDNKPKFVPKRRTPYLLHNEVIKEREQYNVVENKISVEPPQEKIVLDLSDKSADLDKSLDKVIKDHKGVIKESDKDQGIDYMEAISSICGIQKRLLYYFTQCCEMRNENNTGPIPPETLCKAGQTTYKTAKKMLQRMSENKLISRKLGKRGRGGFTRFEIKKEVIEIVKIHKNIESNFLANSGQLPVFNQEPRYQDTSLPADWERIDFVCLMEAFNSNKNIPTQIFGKSQLKTIYLAAGSRLSAEDVQHSLISFAYGYKNYLLFDPYKNMRNPAGVLVDSLKNGDKWNERKYLTPEQESIFKIYKNVSKNIQDKRKEYFQAWVQIDREKKFLKYKDTMRSTEYYDDRVFLEKAWEDYVQKEWVIEKSKLVSQIMGIEDNVIALFEEKLLADEVAGY